MAKSYTSFLTVLFLIFSTVLSAQQVSFWAKTNAASISPTALKKTKQFKKFETFDLQLEALSTALDAAPNRATFKGKSSFKIEFPDKNGKLEAYLIKEAAVMHPDLAKQFPNNRSFVGVSVSNPSKKIHVN